MRTPEQVYECNRKWRVSHPDKSREYTLRYRKKNWEKYLAYARKWNKANRDKRRLLEFRRRERVRNAKRCDKVSANLLAQLISSPVRLKCGICGKNMPKLDRTIDHVIPLSKGGSSEIWNLRIVHLVCNLRKKAKMPDEFNFHE
jgi:5-methylcytosine-specific restriction endonuclease McrA